MKVVWSFKVELMNMHENESIGVIMNKKGKLCGGKYVFRLLQEFMKLGILKLIMWLC